MNGELTDYRPWSRQRWLGVVCGIFALHLGLLKFASAPRMEQGLATERRAAVRWLTEPAQARVILETLLLDDPALLPMANPKAFSGATGLRPRLLEYQVTDWTEAERSLPQPTQALGGAFKLAGIAGLEPVLTAVRKPIATQPGPTRVQPSLRTASRLVIEGGLSGRALVASPAVRSWAHADVLADSLVQVLVTEAGVVFTARHTASPGGRSPAQRAADLHALELARTVRFASVPKSKGGRTGELTEGTLLFQWHTVEPPDGKKD